MSYFTPFLHRLLLRGNEVQTHCVISHGNERGFKWQVNNWKAWDKGTRCSGPGSTWNSSRPWEIKRRRLEFRFKVSICLFSLVYIGQSTWSIFPRVHFLLSKIPNPLFSRQICMLARFALFSKTFQSRWWSSHCFASHSGCRDLSLNTVSIFMGE